MAQYRFQVSLANISLLSEDVVSNTFYANCANDGTAENFGNEIIDFYTDVNGAATSPIGEFIHKGIRRGGNPHTVRVYDLADAEPRVPVFTLPFDLPAPGDSTMLPSEVALCLSFQAAAVSGGNQARRRGRVFIGPFTTAAANMGSGLNDARPDVGIVQPMIESAQMLMASVDGEWAVHSTLSGVLLPVDNGWVDNAFDTQRRRGCRPTTRNPFTAVLP